MTEKVTMFMTLFNAMCKIWVKVFGVWMDLDGTPR